jgi:vacuolar-type H+-ATPase subunit D/Vma8
MEKANEEPAEQPDDRVNIKVRNVSSVHPPIGQNGLRINEIEKDSLVNPSDIDKIKEKYQATIDSIKSVYEKK